MARAKKADDVAPEKLRLVAVELFAKKGFAATGIREIAHAAGITASLLYHYWPTKEDLLVDIMKSALIAIISAAKDALSRVEGPAAQLAALIETHTAAQAINAHEAIVVDTEHRSLVGPAYREVMALRDRYEDLWRDVIDQGCAAGVFSVSDSRVARLALLEMCNGVAWWYRPSGVLSLEAVTRSLADIGLAAVQARSGGRSISVADLEIPQPSVLVAIVQSVLNSRERRGGLRVEAP